MTKYIKKENVIQTIKECIAIQEAIDSLDNLPTIQADDDCISRAEAIKLLNKTYGYPTDALPIKAIKTLPSILPVRPSGEWDVREDIDGLYAICSRCGENACIEHYGKPYDYCPNCGANMRGNDNAIE